MMMLFWLKKVVHAPTIDMITGGQINSTLLLIELFYRDKGQHLQPFYGLT